MERRQLSLSGFVLAGGASRRMGRPKENLVLGGETMLARQLRLVRAVCRSVAVLGPPPSLPGLTVPVFPDDLAGRGPLGGIYTGLRHTYTEFNLFLGCDLPFMESRFLRYLAQQALESQADVIIPLAVDGRLQPLCGVYRRRVRGVVRAFLLAGENKVDSFFHRVRCRLIPWSEIARAGFAPRIFANMNTPEEYEWAKRSIQGVSAVGA